ncbi:forkhead box protein N3 isoform X2 [Lingula anatina]|uniref:Forkhead box protein N3 n=1 Tax=Lingula anatina TaxID=7574 RepID=A0A1S3IUY6_LINAN|nr:forkhead box protein N3 isoform X2 [Lingula anatina]|eukprot:XP_013401354.1 forkhead box protein N3 isoform X2 [Lingula anatina]
MDSNKRLEESDEDFRKRLVDSLSQSFPDSALSKMLKICNAANSAPDSCDELELGDLDPLAKSCFAEIRLDKGPIDEDDDDDLTSLAWLQDSNLLKDIAGEADLEDIPETQKENKEGEVNGKEVSGQVHPPNVPYNPQKHVNSKPPYSFSCLIFMAIEDSPQKRLPVKDIYNWILTHFPYYQNAPTGWKNSVRHNLSLNKCFKKVEKERGQSIGKGSLWCIDPDYRPNLLQALRKTPYHPYHQLQMLANPPVTQTYSYSVLPGNPRPMPLTPRFNLNSSLPPHMDIDVANTLVALKGSQRTGDNPRLKPLTPLQLVNGKTGSAMYRHRSPSPPEFGSERDRHRAQLKRKLRYSPGNFVKKRPRSPVVITNSPSEDHTYSASSSSGSPREHRSISPSSSIDEEYEFGRRGTSDAEDADVSDYHSEASDFEEYDSDVSNLDDGRTSRVRIGGSLEERKMQNCTRTNGCHEKEEGAAEEEDEERKIVEGADALLNLAGIKTASIVPLRAISPTCSTGTSANQEIAAQ